MLDQVLKATFLLYYQVIMSTQQSILSFVKSKSVVAIPSNQSKETLSQAEMLNSEDQQRATDTSTSRGRSHA